MSLQVSVGFSSFVPDFQSWMYDQKMGLGRGAKDNFTKKEIKEGKKERERLDRPGKASRNSGKFRFRSPDCKNEQGEDPTSEPESDEPKLLKMCLSQLQSLPSQKQRQGLFLRYRNYPRFLICHFSYNLEKIQWSDNANGPS